MRALPADKPERFRIETIDLDPEDIEVGDRAQYFQIAFGLGIEIEVEQDIDIGPRAIANRFEVHTQVAQYLSLDIDFGRKRRAKAGPPARRPAVVVGEDVGL